MSSKIVGWLVRDWDGKNRIKKIWRKKKSELNLKRRNPVFLTHWLLFTFCGRYERPHFLFIPSTCIPKCPDHSLLWLVGGGWRGIGDWWRLGESQLTSRALRGGGASGGWYCPWLLFLLLVKVQQGLSSIRIWSIAILKFYYEQSYQWINKKDLYEAVLLP